MVSSSTKLLAVEKNRYNRWPVGVVLDVAATVEELVLLYGLVAEGIEKRKRRNVPFLGAC